MNRKTLRYLPAIIYALLPALLWLYSITANIVSLLASDRGTHMDSPSIGIRWFLASSTESISSLPWGEILLILAGASMIHTSGLLSTIRRAMHRQVRSRRMRSALITAAVTLALTIALILPATIYPWNLLYSITGQLDGSPLADGWIMALFAVTAAITIIFCIVAGTYRNIGDIIKGASQLIATHAHSLVALMPAALFISMSGHLQYPLFHHPITQYIFLALPFICDIYTAEPQDG